MKKMNKEIKITNTILAKGLFLLYTIGTMWFQLEISSHYNTLTDILKIDPRYIILNFLSIGIIYGIIYMFLNKLWLASIVSGFLSTIISVINYYTIELHGMPLSIYEIKNFRTALNVINSYKFIIDWKLILILILFFVVCFLATFFRRNNYRAKLKVRLVRSVCILIAAWMIIQKGYITDKSIKPKNAIGWSWEEAYHTYGYIACVIETIQNRYNFIKIPDNYSEEKIENIEIESINDSERKYGKPDIILILNETFYDLSQIIDIETDNDYMHNIKTMNNIISGYAVVSYSGGGTNSSEYELLTSNSLQLMPGITPFNVLDMTNANSIVSHLNKIGYETLGAHIKSPINYSRGYAYPAMGFKQIHFDQDFTDKQYYGNRWFETDQSLYESINKWYSEFDSTCPRFIYLLTIQNHGGYDMNPKEFDKIHVLNYEGDYKEQIDEYLTSISLSDKAFKNLTEYYSTVERPVIICMVGDHSPTFAEYLVDEKYTQDEKGLRLRSTPFVIWSNKGLDSENLGRISMNYLSAKLLETAGVELSPYYRYILKLSDTIPILTDYGYYYDNDGNIYSYDNDEIYSDIVNDYFYLEYNNLQKNRNQELFDPD